MTSIRFFTSFTVDSFIAFDVLSFMHLRQVDGELFKFYRGSLRVASYLWTACKLGGWSPSVHMSWNTARAGCDLN